MGVTGFVVLLSILAGAAAPEDPEMSRLEYVGSASIPPELGRLFGSAKVSRTHEIVFTVANPFYLWGDFDGDETRDFAVMVGAKVRARDRDAEVIVLRGNGKVRRLEQDVGENRPGPAWYVVPEGAAVGNRPDLNDGREPPELESDAFILARPFSSSALIYWNGSRFELYWQSD